MRKFSISNLTLASLTLATVAGTAYFALNSPATFAATSTPAENFVVAPLAAPAGLQVQGLAIDPFLIEAELEDGGSVQKSIKLTNTTDHPISFVASINDFVVKGKTGQPLFLKPNEQSSPKYTLSSWIKITQQPNFTLAPHADTTINFTITPPNGAEQGTHYGGILFGQTGPSNTPGVTEVENKAGTLILARLGKAVEHVAISEFFTQHSAFQQVPVEFGITVHNFGNVHSRPKGDITIRNMFGQELGQVPVNPDANIVLPESERDFFQSWQPKWAFGRYTAEVVMYYGNPKLELRREIAFWVLPLKEVFLALAVLVILVIIGWKLIPAYNSYIINRSSKL